MRFMHVLGSLQVRFKHDPSSPHAYCGAALSSNVIHITRVAPPADGADGPGEWAAKVGGSWQHKRVKKQKGKDVMACNILL
jgi:selenium-binding protein 1